MYFDKWILNIAPNQINPNSYWQLIRAHQQLLLKIVFYSELFFRLDPNYRKKKENSTIYTGSTK